MNDPFRDSYGVDALIRSMEKARESQRHPEWDAPIEPRDEVARIERATEWMDNHPEKAFEFLLDALGQVPVESQRRWIQRVTSLDSSALLGDLWNLLLAEVTDAQDRGII